MAALRKLVERLTKPIEDLDREQLVAFCDGLDCRRSDQLTPRTHARVAGEVTSVRVVPRAGSPSLEVTISDGHGHVVGVFFGRRRLGGLTPGRRLIFEGMVSSDGHRHLIYNPAYDLLP